MTPSFFPRTFRAWMAGAMRRMRLVPGGSVTVVGEISTANLPGPITAEMALASAAVWACCRVIANSIATLPLNLFEETAEGKRKAFNHPLFKYLNRQPNPEMITSQWIQSTILHLLLWGNGYTFVDRLEDEVIGLWPVMPDDVKVEVGPDRRLVYTFNRGTPFVFPEGSIIHFRLMTLDGLMGLSVIDYHRQTLAFEQAALSYAESMYRKGGRPTGVLKFPGTLKKGDPEAIRASWRAIHGDINNPDIAVLEQGAEYQSIGVPMNQLEYVADKKLSLEAIARIFGVPPHLIGSMDKPTYASVEQQSLEFLRYTINPWVVNIEKSLESALLEPPYFVKFNVNAFERADISSRYRGYAVGRQWGWLSVNDIRRMEDLNEIGSEGDSYLEPLNMIAAANAASQAGLSPRE